MSLINALALVLKACMKVSSFFINIRLEKFL